ncbi:CPBP family intramembrane glutamic endopeptidase [Desulfovibrio sp. JC010]|uniref:CPBP family intramembrane glutamic endopeptidase n=1 Tax=Desulfovibrio sp. JC010 TaxID=2593641 RepID=UPI0013D404F4|nr:CPBP family intramembrane glutamic endopeptidase [Desulfovibrio sp. JC010]NDV28436.1 CPBP family intramembrane metalloprotease [Desulfovibrio sp. JC010]
MKKITIFFLAALPFYLNDFNNIFIKHELAWLAMDYGAKILPLGFLFYLLKKEIIKHTDLGLVSLPFKKFILWTVGITALGLILDEPGFALWSKLLPTLRLGSIPIGTDSPLYALDMTVGLALVAISEEIIFRGLAFSALKDRNYSIPKIFLISAIIFGLIHWSQGPVAIMATAITGSGLMICMYSTGSIYPTIIAHYVINYLSFSGMAVEMWGL